MERRGSRNHVGSHERKETHTHRPTKEQSPSPPFSPKGEASFTESAKPSEMFKGGFIFSQWD
jgi:hypothetical protein